MSAPPHAKHTRIILLICSSSLSDTRETASSPSEFQRLILLQRQLVLEHGDLAILRVTNVPVAPVATKTILNDIERLVWGDGGLWGYASVLAGKQCTLSDWVCGSASRDILSSPPTAFRCELRTSQGSPPANRM